MKHEVQNYARRTHKARDCAEEEDFPTNGFYRNCTMINVLEQVFRKFE